MRLCAKGLDLSINYVWHIHYQKHDTYAHHEQTIRKTIKYRIIATSIKPSFTHKHDNVMHK